MSPFFSIVIPTRQRHETLPFAIKTVLQQSFLDYEIIVSDNCSSYETFQVVQELNNPKIKYIRSEIPLSMSDNWELAVSQCSGKYIILFGDDDGLVNGSLLYLYEVIKETGFEVIRWERVYYSWPNIYPVQFANCLSLPIGVKNHILRGKNVIQNLINLKTGYTNLPMLYNSAVKKDILIKLKGETGRLFRSITPDVYSGYALAYISDNYLSLGKPLSINGGSAKSNGASHMFQPTSNAIVSDFKQLNEKSALNFHSQIPNIRSLTATLIEPFLQFQDAITIDDIKIDMKLIYNAIIRDVRVLDVEEKNIASQILEKHLQQNKLLKPILRSKLWKNFNLSVCDLHAVSGYKKGYSDNMITFDASDFDLFNVLDVSKFVAKFYEFDDSKNLNITDHNVNGLKLYKNILKRIYSATRALVKGY